MLPAELVFNTGEIKDLHSIIFIPFIMVFSLIHILK